MRPELEIMTRLITEERIATREEIDVIYNFCFGAFWELPSDEDLASSKDLRNEELSIIEEESNRRGAGVNNYYGFIISYIKKFDK